MIPERVTKQLHEDLEHLSRLLTQDFVLGYGYIRQQNKADNKANGEGKDVCERKDKAEPKKNVAEGEDTGTTGLV